MKAFTITIGESEDPGYSAVVVMPLVEGLTGSDIFHGVTTVLAAMYIDHAKDGFDTPLDDFIEIVAERIRTIVPASSLARRDLQ